MMRLSLGWLFFYAGLTKIINPKWSAAGYISGSKVLFGFYSWLLQPNILPVINFLNEWGLTFIGLALILGIFVRFASFFGALMMLLYYLPILDFPYPNAHAYLVDEHIIYITALLVLFAFRAGRVWGWDQKFASRFWL